MSGSLKPIHVWATGIRDDTGGIQAFSRFFVKALREGLPDRPMRVFVRNETLAPGDSLLGQGIDLHTFEKLPPRMRSHALAASASYHALRDRPACMLSTHMHFFPPMRAVRAVTGAPYGGVLHGIEAWRIRSHVRLRGMQEADKLLAVSQFTRDHVVRESQVRPERISVFPNTFDAARFAPGPKPERLMQKYGLRPDQPVLLTVSRLALSERYKGHWQVLISLKRILQQIPNAHYLVVGTGDEISHLRAGVRMLGLERHVTFAGFVSTEDLPDHYRLCDAFVMPSTKEGFGIVFLEAAACGKPVIGGFLDGSYDALDGGRLGMLVDPHHPAGIAAGILSVLQKTTENPLLSDPSALSAAVKEQFGFQSFKRQLIEEVRPLLEREKSSSTMVSVPQRPPQCIPRAAEGRRPRIAVLTQLNSPYQVEFFNRVAAVGDCHLEVVYLTHRDKNRLWASPDIAHSHIILSETPHLEGNAIDSLLNADLAVFNYYTSRFAWRAIRLRAATGQPWAFWGERPGFLHLGATGTWFRWLALKPLHRSRAPIWGVGHFGIEGYRVEFGRARPYHNMPYYSELERFRVSRIASPPGGRAFVYSGSLSKRKGVDLLARAFVRIAPQFPLARLVLVGAGPLEQDLREILYPVQDRVEWCGFQSWAELPRFYAKGDVFCFPSRYDGWGLALVEALASGLPSIATDQTGAAIDLIAPGRNGWLVKTSYEAGLAQVMREALELPAEAFSTMQQAAVKSVRLQGVEEGAQNFIRTSCEVVLQWDKGV
jgi:glycosyltransferase involved in cell wall biosynthesis